MIRWDAIRCKLGAAMMAEWDRRGICWLSLAETLSDVKRQQHQLVAMASAIMGDQPQLCRDANLRDDLEAILSEVEVGKSPPQRPLFLHGTDFQRRVWSALLEIPPGVTRSYSEVASQLGRPGCQRAVAQACARNRIALLIPCHRLIGSDGRLRGYRWGIDRKQRLLQWEQQAVGDQQNRISIR